jgi:eukaryotic-like serine/threonine-protein kinase
MRRKLLRLLGLAAYGGFLLVLFGAAAYLSFNLFVRSGVTRTPDLTGLTREQAGAALAEQGLRWSSSEPEGRYSETVPAGQVVQQRPGAGSLVKRGSRVEVVLSQGPQRLTVPDLAGQALPAAQVALAAAGLSVGRTVSVYSSQAAPGTVVEQDPPPQASVAPSTAVDLLLALDDSGGTYLMPDLVYRGYPQVKRFFETQGFRLGSVRFEAYEGVPEGVILRQFPLAGHPLGRRDAISLVVAAGEGH